MKKILALLLVAVMCLSFVACGENDTENAKDAEKTSATKLSLNITGVGQEIKFGSYPKTSDGAYDDVQWVVLDVQGDKALLISKYAIEPKNSWDVSEVSEYMSSITQKMFTEEEKSLIEVQSIDGVDSHLFLLNAEEVEKYMPEKSNSLRVVQATGYAVDKGVKTYTNSKLSGCCNWVLRDGCWVGGQLGNQGKISDHSPKSYYGICPAVWVSVA